MSDKDIVARAREFLNGPNYTVGDHLALLRALADEVERLRGAVNDLEQKTTPSTTTKEALKPRRK